MSRHSQATISADFYYNVNIHDSQVEDGWTRSHVFTWFISIHNRYIILNGKYSESLFIFDQNFASIQLNLQVE